VVIILVVVEIFLLALWGVVRNAFVGGILIQIGRWVPTRKAKGFLKKIRTLEYAEG
jgi:hypothetical protein